MKIERFENIEAWQLGRKLTKHETAETTRGKIAGFIKFLLEFEKSEKP